MSLALTPASAETPNDPLGTSTTSNFEKLVNRIERGDGGGCPILAIAITTKAYKQHLGDFNKDLTVVALSHQAGTPVVRMAERMGLGQADLDEVSSDTPDEDDAE